MHHHYHSNSLSKILKMNDSIENSSSRLNTSRHSNNSNFFSMNHVNKKNDKIIPKKSLKQLFSNKILSSKKTQNNLNNYHLAQDKKTSSSEIIFNKNIPHLNFDKIAKPSEESFEYLFETNRNLINESNSTIEVNNILEIEI